VSGIDGPGVGSVNCHGQAEGLIMDRKTGLEASRAAPRLGSLFPVTVGLSLRQPQLPAAPALSPTAPGPGAVIVPLKFTSDSESATSGGLGHLALDFKFVVYCNGA
jgi:hypothetical protein